MVNDAPSPWNIANVVTMIRIAMVPFFAWALLVEGGDDTTWRIVATAIFVVAAVSDKVDGYLARSRGLITDLGKLLDPIADKLLVGAALILLWIPLGELPWWIPVIILVRELGITFMRMGMLKYEVMPASRGGKLKTVLQAVAISMFLLPAGRLRVVHGDRLGGADGGVRRDRRDGRRVRLPGLEDPPRRTGQGARPRMTAPPSAGGGKRRGAGPSAWPSR